ncbi:unnamed protein product, partial [Musa acuminata var. zebrina]
PQRALGRSVVRECLRVNRMLGLVGEQEAWTDLPSEPSAHQILRLGSRVMRYEQLKSPCKLSCPVPPPKHSAAMLETLSVFVATTCVLNRLDTDGLWWHLRSMIHS